MKDSKNNIVCFGEVLWDVYPDGKKLGGAPFNVAAHLTQLGTQGHIITKVGNDVLGKEILEAIDQNQIDKRHTQIDQFIATGVVNVTLDNQGKPTYDIKQPSAWDFIQSTRDNKLLIQQSNALLFGSLACRTSENFSTLQELTKLAPLNICDLNIRLEYYSKDLIDKLLGICDVLKINDEEAELLCDLYHIEMKSLYTFLSDHYAINLVIQTLGAEGAEAYHDGIIYKAKGILIHVVDTVGSGDAFLACFIHNYILGKKIDDCLAEGCRLGAYVATQSGAIPRHN